VLIDPHFNYSLCRYLYEPESSPTLSHCQTNVCEATKVAGVALRVNLEKAGELGRESFHCLDIHSKSPLVGQYDARGPQLRMSLRDSRVVLGLETPYIAGPREAHVKVAVMTAPTHNPFDESHSGELLEGKLHEQFLGCVWGGGAGNGPTTP
jgi:hypothetical protein